MGSIGAEIQEDSIRSRPEDTEQAVPEEVIPSSKRFETILLMSALSVRSLQLSIPDLNHISSIILT